jgi:hypothetical protein
MSAPTKLAPTKPSGATPTTVKLLRLRTMVLPRICGSDAYWPFQRSMAQHHDRGVALRAALRWEESATHVQGGEQGE